MERKYDIIWHEQLDSTNNEVIRNIVSLDNLSVTAAMEQTAGRGQRGNTWKSVRGLNLTFSILLKFGSGSLPCIMARDQFLISQIATVSLHDFLKARGIDTRIKWPNDIYAGGRKISGMLIENSLVMDMVSTSVIGIGLNVNQTDFPPELPNPVSMAALTGTRYDVRTLLEDYLAVFDSCLAAYPDDTGRIRTLYEDLMYWKDERHTFLNCRTGIQFEGTIRGTTGIGMLSVETPEGKTMEFGFKEIAFISGL